MGGRNDQANRHQPRNINKVCIRSTISLATAVPNPQSAPHTQADNEADSNADTTVMGTNFALLSLSRRTADVYAFDPSIPSTTVPIATGATVYDHPEGYPILLVFHEALWYGEKLDHSLINPNQIRSYGIPFWDNPFDTTRTLGMELSPNVSIPFETRGTKILFTSRVPTTHELRDPHILRFEVTSPHDWNPQTVSLSSVTTPSNLDTTIPHGLGWKTTVAPATTTTPPIHYYYDPTSDEALLHSIDTSLLSTPSLHDTLNSTRISQLDADPHDRPTRHTFVSNERHQRATAETLSEYFGIGKAHRALL